MWRDHWALIDILKRASTLQQSRCGAAKHNDGHCASCAFLSGVTVLVTPGPAVTAATPGVPVRRETASAAKTAVASLRTSIDANARGLGTDEDGRNMPSAQRKQQRDAVCAQRRSDRGTPIFTGLPCYRCLPASALLAR